MTRLLVSVRTLDEAHVAAQAGVDLIDVKEPTRGSLGMADVAIRLAIGQQLGPQHQLSAACGELCDWHKAPWPAAASSAWNYYRYAKIGLANSKDNRDWRSNWLLWRQALPANVEPVLVCYADHFHCNAPSFQELREYADEQRIGMFLIDTYDKRGPGLGQLWQAADFLRIGQELRQAGIAYVLAGKLSLDEIPLITGCGPDYLGVRGAVCDPLHSSLDMRSGILSEEKIKKWQAALTTGNIRASGVVTLAEDNRD